MKHILPTETINKVLNYLATRPYTDVANLIRDLQSQAVPYVDESSPCDESPASIDAS